MTAKHVPRRALAALLLAAVAVAIFAGSTLAATTNLVKNGSFEKDTNGDGLPNNWVYGQNIAPGDKRVCNQSYAGACSFKMIGDANYKWLYQNILIAGLAGDEFSLSAWTKGKSIVYGISGVTRLALEFIHTGGGSSTYFGYISAAGNTPWTLRQLLGAEAIADFDSITVYLEVQADSGKIWFDKLKLVPSP
jgi:hypothetical protein